MSPYSFLVVALPCVAVLAAIVAGTVTYAVSRRLKLLKGLVAAVLACGAIALALPTFGYLHELNRRPRQALEPSNLAGFWTTSYQDIGPFRASGVETLALKADGTYQQTYENGSYVYKSSWNSWWIEDGWIIRLMHGRFYPYGVSWAEDFATSGTKIRFMGDVTLDGTEIVLFARPDPNAPDQLVLEHLPVGDPDSPDVVQFRRVSTQTP